MLGHSLHPMLVVFPLGLFPATVICDLLRLALRNPLFGIVAFWMLTFGIAGALAAAVPGFIDWLSIPEGTRAKRIGLRHMLVQITGLGFFVMSWWARIGLPLTHWAPLALALIGLSIILVGAWLGGELVQQHGIGVRREAGVNAPNSLSADHAAKTSKPVRGPTEPSPV